MLKYYNTQVVFQEFPGEITLAINLTNCPNHCPGCHSPWLQEDTGKELTTKELCKILEPHVGSVTTCIGFMGGDNDASYLHELVEAMHETYPGFLIGWYTGKDLTRKELNKNYPLYKYFDYIKTGPYVEALGGLDKPTTNQRMYCKISKVQEWLDITRYFQTMDQQFRSMVNNFNGYLNYMDAVGAHWNEEHPDCPFPSLHTIYESTKSGLEKYFLENCQIDG